MIVPPDCVERLEACIDAHPAPALPDRSSSGAAIRAGSHRCGLRHAGSSGALEHGVGNPIAGLGARSVARRCGERQPDADFSAMSSMSPDCSTRTISSASRISTSVAERAVRASPRDWRLRPPPTTKARDRSASPRRADCTSRHEATCGDTRALIFAASRAARLRRSMRDHAARIWPMRSEPKAIDDSTAWRSGTRDARLFLRAIRRRHVEIAAPCRRCARR